MIIRNSLDCNGTNQRRRWKKLKQARVVINMILFDAQYSEVKTPLGEAFDVELSPNSRFYYWF